jgi:hypothetical protein
MYDWVYVNLMIAITSDFTIPGAYAAIQSKGPGYDLPVPRFLQNAFVIKRKKNVT